MLCKATMEFCFQNLKPTTKGSLFSNENYFKLLPYLAEMDFVSKRKLFSKLSFDPKNCCLKQNGLHKWLLKKLALQNFGTSKCFQLVFKLASQKHD
jgi:hypothetical protein